eukprot:445606-Pyramimonas_sp.AAC.1
MEYEADHKEQFDMHGYPWPPSKDDFAKLGLAEAVEHLPPRAAECVYFHYRSAVPTGHGWLLEKETVVDLNMSLNWQ